MNNELKKFVLKGKALVLKTGVYDKGERKTVKEWYKELYPGSDPETSPSAIYRLIKICLRGGYPVVPYPMDPSQPNERGSLVPLTQKMDYMLHANKRCKKQITGRCRTLTMMMEHEVLANKKMTPNLEEDIDEFLAQYTSMKKIIHNK